MLALGIMRERERERKMELQSVRIDGRKTVVDGAVNTSDPPASDEQVSISSPDLLSTFNSSSMSSSPQSSPAHHHNTTSASSSNMSPSLQADPQIHEEPVSSSASRRPQRFSKEQSMKSLKESIPHSMKLQHLQELDKDFQKTASKHKKAVRRLSKQLYMIVSLYALVQGTLFAAVAVTNTITCDDWWGPVGIAGAVTLGTLRATLDKLWRMSQKNQEVKIFQKRQNAVFDKIRLLYFKGSACTMEELEPQHTDVFNPAPGFICFFSLHSLLVLGFLVGFSALIITSCTGMLCRPCHCSHP